MSTNLIVMPPAPAPFAPPKPFNPFEELNRLRRAIRLADLLDSMGQTANDVAGLHEGRWHMAALAIQMDDPSPETCRLVVELLKAKKATRELAKPTCPHCGGSIA